MVSTFIAQVLAIVILCPFTIMILPIAMYRRTGKPFITALGQVADVTTPFLFLSIYIVSRTIFGAGVGFYIAIVAIVITIMYAIIERQRVKEFQIKKLLRKVWRFLFLVLTGVYVLLLITGIGFKIWEYIK